MHGTAIELQRAPCRHFKIGREASRHTFIHHIHRAWHIVSGNRRAASHGFKSTPGHVCGGKVTGDPFLRMDGQAVFKLAVRVLDEVARETLALCEMQPGDLDWLIPHQANVRILDATAKKLGVAADKVIVTVDRHANTSAASVPLALDVAVRDGRIKPGHNVLLEGVGGGFTWGAALVRM